MRRVILRTSGTPIIVEEDVFKTIRKEVVYIHSEQRWKALKRIWTVIVQSEHIASLFNVPTPDKGEWWAPYMKMKPWDVEYEATRFEREFNRRIRRIAENIVAAEMEEEREGVGGV